MGAIRDIFNAGVSRVRRASVERKLIDNLNSKIGGESVVGLRNLATHRSKIKEFVKAGDIAGANAYVKQQSQKVYEQSRIPRFK